MAACNNDRTHSHGRVVTESRLSPIRVHPPQMRMAVSQWMTGTCLTPWLG